MARKKNILFVLVNEKNHFEVISSVLEKINNEANVQLWSYFEIKNYS